MFDRCSVRVANLHSGGYGVQAGSKHWRDGMGGSDIGAVWDDMRRSSEAGGRRGGGGDCWDWTKLHTKVAAAGDGGGAIKAAEKAGAAGGGASAGVTSVDMKKTSLGQMSSIFGAARVGQKRGLLQVQGVPGLNLANGAVKKAKVEGEDAAASTASTATTAAE